MENAPAGEEGVVLAPASVLQGRQGQAFLCCNTVSRETRSGSSSSSGGGSSSKSSGSSRSKSGSIEESSSSEDTQEYDRHLAQAQRQDLSKIAATRALYVAGEDRRGRTCVVFSPELVRDHQSPAAPAPKNKSLKKRGNSFETQQKLELPRQPQHPRRPPDASTAGGSAGAEDGWSSARKTSPRTQAGSRLDTGAVGGSSQSSISRRGRTAAASPRNRHTAVGGQMAETSAGTASAAVGVPVAAAGGPLSALESSVGSAAMEELLLYFVRMMDPIADREYVLLLCGGCPDVVGDDSGKIRGRATAFLPGGERSGWLTWGRFSMLGQMHSLLPRRFKKNLAGLVVLQPTPVLHAFFDFANLFLSPKFYQKLEFCDGVEELTVRFPRRIIENLPEGVLSAAAQGRSGRQSAAAATVPSPAASRWHSSPGAEDWLGSSNRGRSLTSPRALDLPPTEKDDRPSPLRVARVVAGGMQVQGDDNWTPPPLPPPPLQSASKPASPLLGGGSARSGSKGKGESKIGVLATEAEFQWRRRLFSLLYVLGFDGVSACPTAKRCCYRHPRTSFDTLVIDTNLRPPLPPPVRALGRFHRATLEKRFSTSSATLTLTPKSTPSPEASASASSVGYGASTPMATATVTTTPTRKHYASFGGGAYASVSAASSAVVIPTQIYPMYAGSSFQCGHTYTYMTTLIPAQPSHRRGASTGGCWDRGRGPHSFSGGGRTGGVSPTTPKGTGHSRRSAFANGTGTNSSPSPWSPPTAANVSGDRQSLRPSPSPSPRGGRGVVTPRGTSAQRGSWGGSPCSGGGFRSSPTTPRHAGTPNQVSFASTSGLPARKGSRGGGSPAGGGQRQPQPKQQKQQKQLHRLSSWPVVGDEIGGGGGSGWSSGVVGGNAGAASPRAIALSAGSGWGGSGFHTASGVIEVSQRGEMRGAAPQKSKSSPRQLPQKSPRAKRPVDSGRISVSSERPENVGAPALSGGPGKAKDGRKRHSFTFANSRGNARRSSSGQITSQQQQQQQMTRPESPLRPRPRSSSNILSPTEIAALEREVKCRSARVTSSAARSAGFVRYSVASRVNGSGGGGSGGGSGSGFAVSDRGLTLSPPSASRTAVAGDASCGDGDQDGDRAGEHGRGAGAGAAVGKARDRGGERKPMATVSRNTSGGNGGSGSRSRDAGGGAAMRGGGGAEVTSYCPAPADHPAPLRRASEGAQMIKSAAAVTRSSRGRGGGGGRAGVIGRSSVSGCGGGATVKHLSTSARISPGIQALMANYGAATRASPGAAGTPTPAFPPKAATAAAAAAATAVGDGVCDGSGRKATTAATPRAAPSSSPLPPPAATATSLPLRAAGRESSPPASRAGVFASAPGGGPADALSGDGVPTGSRTTASNTTASNSTSASPFGVAEAGRGSARGSGAVASGSAGESLRSQQQQQQQHRGQHRYDAGGMRRALRKHRESLQSALKAEGAAAAVAAAVAEAKAAEEGDADNGGMNEAGNVETRSEAVQRRRKLPDPTNKVFGVPLVEILQRTPGEDIPWVLKRFVGFLSKFGLESVGLFRLAGDGMDRAVLRDALDHGKQVCWDPADDREGGKAAGVRLTDVNMVAQLLKAFVRELPEPLIPFSVYGKVVAVAKATGGADAQWVQAMRSILWSIPNANYNCLRYLFEFLREVASHSSTNRMTSENLAIVWAPNLLRPQVSKGRVTTSCRRESKQTKRLLFKHGAHFTVFDD
ncbi:unnamed protein product [Scytosiphon promiscuus]